jgi:hypothetical protein
MASATVREVKKTRTIQEDYIENDGVHLELTREEASYLCAVLGWAIVGDGPLRGHNTQIYLALKAHGFNYFENVLTRDMSRSIKGTVDVSG